MKYFVTGGTGFIGGLLVGKLLERGGDVTVLVRSETSTASRNLQERWAGSPGKLSFIEGDITRADLDLSPATVSRLKGGVDHFFHLAAIYDLDAPEAAQQQANVTGTGHAVDLAVKLNAGCFHHVSSIAVAGLYRGRFREDMFEQAKNLDNPYLRTKHDAERVVRETCSVPWKVYRPGMVVGHSKTGEISKIDGPYYFFKLIQRLRNLIPQWIPVLGLEGGRINVVPVDYVVDAMDHIAHRDNLDSQCFHLTDPEPYRVGELMNIFCRAAHGPQMALRLDSRVFSFIPAYIREGVLSLPPVKRLQRQLLASLQIPEEAIRFIAYPTTFDCCETRRALAGSGIQCPDLKTYAPAVWDYWERQLDPELFTSHTLRDTVAGKVVVLTGGSSGIGEAAGYQLAEAGATVILVARTREKLEAIQHEIKNRGGTAFIYPCDISRTEDCDRLVETVLEDHQRIDILVNCAGRSIRRSVEQSLDRFHDFQRTMQLNYFGALRLVLGFLPTFVSQRAGHVINVSSIGVLSNAPRFSAYVASKAALDAFSRCAAAEYTEKGVNFTSIYMPLVKTPMLGEVNVYKQVPLLTPEQAADLIAEAIIYKPKRIATRLGAFAEIVYAIAPKFSEIIMNTGFNMFPDTGSGGGKSVKAQTPTTEQVAFAAMMKGIHW